MAWSFLRRCLSRTPPPRRRVRPGLELLEKRELLSANYYVSPTGDDWNTGAADHPFITLQRALDAVQPGDVINLHNGVYTAGVTIDVNNLTIRSCPGEWAVLTLPVNDPQQRSVLRYNFNTQGGTLQNLEITGGYWYGVMMWDWWDPNWSPGTTHVGASGITIQGCKIHDTGYDAVKITPGANNVTVENNEIFNTGRRIQDSADGIDDNHGDNLLALDNYIHDTTGSGILTSGGTVGSVIDGNLVMNAHQAGIRVGFGTELEWMTPATNPNLYASINEIARNNIIVNAAEAGIGIHASLNPRVYNNTIVNCSSQDQAPILLSGEDVWIPNSPTEQHVANANPFVVNNLVTVGAGNPTRVVDIRYQSYTGALTLDHNLYSDQDMNGAQFIDRNTLGDAAPECSLSQWQVQFGHDASSTLADPQLDGQYHLTAGSPAINSGIAVAGLQFDYDGNPRSDGLPDVGADEFGAGPNLLTPPAPFGAPTLEIADGKYHGAEGTTIMVKVVREGSLADTLTVAYTTLDGNAKAGTNYTAVQGTLTFAPGEQMKLVPVQLLHDPSVTGDQDFLFRLSNPTTNGTLPVRLGYQTTSSVTIDDIEVGETLNYRTLYVAPGGSDVTGDGSAAKPWHSLQFAANNVGPGDYVVVEPGNYWGFHLTTSGKPDATITFHALPGVVIDTPDPVLHQDGIDLEGASYVTVENFEVDNMPRAGIRSVLNTGAVIRGNRIDHSEMWGILTGWSDNVLIEGNDISNTVEQHGIYVSNSSDYDVVRNNLVWSNHDSGIQFNADATLPGDGIHAHCTIDGNVLYDNGAGGGAAINLDGFQDGVVSNNLLHDNHATGIVLYVYKAADGSKNNLVVNNTVVQAPDGRWALLMENGSSGNTLLNNILLNENPNAGSVTADSSSKPALSDYNSVQDQFQIDGVTTNFAAWQAFTGQETHSFLAAPSDLFIDTPNPDFHLKPGSPAIGAGTSYLAPAVDAFQHPRPQGQVDVGAVQSSVATPLVQFGWSYYAGYQDSGLAVLDVVRSGDTESALTVNYLTAGGSAVPGVDYVPASGTLTFRPGEVTKTLFIQLTNPTKLQPLKTVFVVLSDPSGATQLGMKGAAILTLVSDSTATPGALSFTAAATTVNDNDGTATVTVQRNGGTDGTVTVQYSTGQFTPPKKPNWSQYHTLSLYPPDNDAVATTPDDYLPVGGTLTFGPGETSKTFTVPIVNDPWFESDEAFLVSLSNPTGGAMLDTQATAKVRIHTDKVAQPGAFTWAVANYSVAKGTSNFALTVTRTAGSNVAASVLLYQSGGSYLNPSIPAAWAPSAYNGVPSVLNFAPGEVSKTILLNAVQDNQVTGNRAFTIQLYSPTNGATIGALAKTVVLITDTNTSFSFQSGTFTTNEGAQFAVITIVRNGNVTAAGSVNVGLTGYTARPGTNFVMPNNWTVSFAPGQATQTFQIALLDDHVKTNTLWIGLQLKSPVGGMLGYSIWANLYIQDID